MPAKNVSAGPLNTRVRERLFAEQPHCAKQPVLSCRQKCIGRNSQYNAERHRDNAVTHGGTCVGRSSREQCALTARLLRPAHFFVFTAFPFAFGAVFAVAAAADGCFFVVAGAAAGGFFFFVSGVFASLASCSARYASPLPTPCWNCWVLRVLSRHLAASSTRAPAHLLIRRGNCLRLDQNGCRSG